MSKHLSIEEKAEKLRSIGYFIEKKLNGWIIHFGKRNADNPAYCAMFGMVTPTDIKTNRDLSKTYKEEFTKPKKWKKIVKKMTNDKDRAAQRDLIKTENFDKIPEGERIVYEDCWKYN